MYKVAKDGVIISRMDTAKLRELREKERLLVQAKRFNNQRQEFDGPLLGGGTARDCFYMAGWQPEGEWLPRDTALGVYRSQAQGIGVGR